MLGMTWGDISPWIFYDMGLPLLLVAAAAYLLGCSNAVSYTHLDVYKRQVLRGPGGRSAYWEKECGAGVKKMTRYLEKN